MQEINMIERGQTYYGPTQTIDTSNYAGINLEGKICHSDDRALNATAARSDQRVITILARNTSGITLYGKTAVTWEAGYRGRRVDGLAYVPRGEVAGVVDDRLGSGGVRTGDLFHLIVRGPCLAKLSTAAAEAVVAAGDRLVGATAATSQATATAGCFTDANLTGATAVLANEILNHFAVAVSASTTADTGAEQLIRVCNLGY